MSSPRTRLPRALALAVLAAGAPWPPARGEAGTALEPLALERRLGQSPPTAAIWSSRTLAVGLEVDRDGSRVVGFTRKDRPLIRPATGPATKRGYVEGADVQIEVVLRGPGDAEYTDRVDVGPLCFLHDGDAPPHVEGDTIRVHRDTFVVELPDLEGFDTVEIAYYDRGKSAPSRRELGRHRLDADLFRDSPVNGATTTATGRREAPDATAKAYGSVIWPEELGDPDVYRVYGNAAEAATRINVTIVPDGYTHLEKARLESDADRLVNAFRNKTPYRELDPFINYTLVYAYSNSTGTDQCDCGSTVDSAMGTYFPAAGGACGSSTNRCLYYGGGCDTARTENIVAAELRAPAHDETIVMVNTLRYGGCGGARAVYSAGNSSAVEIALHELGHSLAGLADEYGGTNACGYSSAGVNTSTNATVGAWPEWIDDLGAPQEGGRYYDRCIYRPSANCAMRALYYPFCAVCRQHWVLVTFAHPRVAPTAPIASVDPVEPTVLWQGQTASFTAATRLPVGTLSGVVWTVQGPDEAQPTTVLTGATELTYRFDEPGWHRVTLEVTAATSFVKPERHGANRDTALFEVEVLAPILPGEISYAGTTPLSFDDRTTLRWEDAGDAGVTSYNVYRGEIGDVRAGDCGTCFASNLAANEATEPAAPPAGTVWTYLVTGVNPAGEGTAGTGSGAAARDLSAPCR